MFIIAGVATIGVSCASPSFNPSPTPPAVTPVITPIPATPSLLELDSSKPHPPEGIPLIGVYLLVDESNSAKQDQRSGSERDDPECRHDAVRFILTSVSQLAYDVRERGWFDPQPEQLPWLGLAYFAYGVEEVITLQGTGTLRANDYVEMSRLNDPPQPGGNGTNFEEALNTARQGFERALDSQGQPIPFSSKVIILLTDGRFAFPGAERLVGKVLDELIQSGYRVYVVLVAKPDDTSFNIWIRWAHDYDKLVVKDAWEKEQQPHCPTAVREVTEAILGDFLAALFSDETGGGWGWLEGSQLHTSIEIPLSRSKLHIGALSLSGEPLRLGNGMEIGPWGQEIDLEIQEPMGSCGPSSQHEYRLDDPHVANDREIALYWWHSQRPYIKVIAEVPEIRNNAGISITTTARWWEYSDENIADCYRVKIEIGTEGEEEEMTLREALYSPQGVTAHFGPFSFYREGEGLVILTLIDTTDDTFRQSVSGNTSVTFRPEGVTVSEVSKGENNLRIVVSVKYGNPELYEDPLSAEPLFFLVNSEVHDEVSLNSWQDRCKHCSAPEDGTRFGYPGEWVYKVERKEYEHSSNAYDAEYTLNVLCGVIDLCYESHKALYVEWPTYGLSWRCEWGGETPYCKQTLR